MTGNTKTDLQYVQFRKVKTQEYIDFINKINKKSNGFTKNEQGYWVAPKEHLKEQFNLLLNYLEYPANLPQNISDEKLKEVLFDSAFKCVDGQGDNIIHWLYLDQHIVGTDNAESNRNRTFRLTNSILDVASDYPEQVYTISNSRWNETLLQKTINGFKKYETKSFFGNIKKVYDYQLDRDILLEIISKLLEIGKGHPELVFMNNDNKENALELAIKNELPDAIIKKIAEIAKDPKDLEPYQENPIVAEVLKQLNERYILQSNAVFW